MKTDYASHETAYKRLKAKGQPGWGTEEDYKMTFEVLLETISQDCFPKGGRLLELGCGAGNVSLWFAERGYEVVGVDIAPTAIEWAKEGAINEKARIDFRLGDVLTLRDYPAETFDIVLDGHCLHCIIGRDRQDFLRSAWRVLKPGGYFHVHTMCGPNICQHAPNYDPESRCTIRNGVATRYIGLPDDILDEIIQAGFNIRNWHIRPAVNEDDQDSLVVGMVKE